MVSQVIFKIDTKLKQQAMKKAKKEGMSFSYFLKLVTRSYINGSLDVLVGFKEKIK